MHPGEKNLNTFRILFLIKGILDLLLIFFGIIYASIGAFAGNTFRTASRFNGDPLPFNPANFFITIGVIIIILAAVTGTVALIASTRLKEKRGRKFIIIASGINCVTGILGILLCIFTVIELQKTEVKELFEQKDGPS